MINIELAETGFQTTYEELKLLLKWSHTINWASRLPMRNWNFDGTARGKIRVVLPDYLWGIETSISLSHRICLWLPDYLWGIETLMLTDALKLLRCFQTTYEELKLQLNCVRSIEEEKASRLPMRNWNTLNVAGISFAGTSFQTTYEELKQAYLSLIEYVYGFQTTYEELKHRNELQIDTQSGASRLPMRNWNFC